jgi:hypothetical protein
MAQGHTAKLLFNGRPVTTKVQPPRALRMTVMNSYICQYLSRALPDDQVCRRRGHVLAEARQGEYGIYGMKSEGWAPRRRVERLCGGDLNQPTPACPSLHSSRSWRSLACALREDAQDQNKPRRKSRTPASTKLYLRPPVCHCSFAVQLFPPDAASDWVLGWAVVVVSSTVHWEAPSSKPHHRRFLPSRLPRHLLDAHSRQLRVQTPFSGSPFSSCSF